jgi:hypothetical protein
MNGLEFLKRRVSYCWRQFFFSAVVRLKQPTLSR